jgi:ribosomal protein S11
MKGYILRTSALWVRGLILALFTQYAYAQVRFAKTYGGTDEDVASFVQQTSDGGYIVAGFTTSFGTGYDAFLINTDANGNIIWAKAYGGTSYASSVQQTSDGGYIVAGSTYSSSTGSNDIFLIKTDAKGNIQWAKTYGETDTINMGAYSVQQTSDGGYILAGTTISFGAGEGDIFLIKTDARGNIGSCSIVQDASPIVNNAPFGVTSQSPAISSPSPIVNSVSPTVTSPNLTVSAPCP